MKFQHEYNEQPQQSGSYGHDILPPPVQPQRAPGSVADDRTAFPPIGATLPAYAPPMYGQSQAGAGQPGVGAGAYPGTMPGIRPGAADKPQRAKAGWKKRLKRAFITLLIIGLLAGGYVGIKLLYNASKSFDGNLFGLLQNDKLDGEDTGRVNILLAGNSADDVGHSGGDLTDSIMIVSLDTKNNTAFMLSVPRDLWVETPGYGYGKINSTFVYGKAENFSTPGYPSGGMGALQQVIEQNFDIDINYYALVNYTALRDAVNAVGGIDVNIKSTDPRGLYDPSRDWSGPRGTVLVKLPNGVNHLNGQQALNLARARGDAYGSYGYGLADFTRASNQRLMLVALKDKTSTAGVAANPVKLGKLLDSFGSNVQTDFQTNEVRRLAELAKKIPNSSIKSISLNDADGENLLTSYRSRNGQSALIPAAGVDDFSEINAYLLKVMTPPPPPAPAAATEE
ncbi:MAG TPA: LCP family protein [Candidatus Saccharimonadales bacterium]|jgi:LCP family protein required for cell wall assembly